ncbi:MAG: PKD domain-containing protein [Thermoplasmata archaeon]|nr:PKD domain-containing protein [Thermoplasmata archaeon]
MGPPARADMVPALGGMIIDYNITPNPGDQGLPIAFNATATGCGLGCTYAWGFGDGSPMVGAQNTNHTFNSSGIFTIDLWVNGTIGTSSNTLQLTVNSHLKLSANESRSVADADELVNLTAVPLGGTPPVAFAWRLGDGTRVTGANVSHAFASPGSYDNEVWANDTDHQSVFGWRNVTVNPALNFTVQSSLSRAETGETVNFSANTSGGTGPLGIAWQFGDGFSGGGSDASHIYGTPGNFTPQVWINDSAGVSKRASLSLQVLPGVSANIRTTGSESDVGIPIQFQGSSLGGESPINYSWSFGDGSRAVGSEVDYSFPRAGTFTVDLWTNDSMQRSSLATELFTVNPALEANELLSPSTTDVGSVVAMNPTLLYGSSPYTTEWTFGDGQRSNSLDAQHMYASPGRYTVTLYANDSAGGSVVDRANVTILLAVGAHASLDVPFSDVGIGIPFQANGTGGSGIFSYLWLFGDGTTSQSASPIHSYSAAGNFAPRVFVNDSVGGSFNESFPITIHGRPDANPIIAPQQSAPGEAVELNGWFAGGTGPYSFSWALGDGSSNSAQNLTHTYEAAGTYSLHFWVNDSQGASSEANLSLTVVPATLVAPTTSFWATPLWMWLFLGLIAGAVLVGAVSLARRNHDPFDEDGASAATELEEPDHSGEPGDLPAWPNFPLTVLEGDDPRVAYRVAAASGLSQDGLLIFTPEDPATVGHEFGLEHARILRVTRLEGDGFVSPGDLDRIGHLCEAHLQGGPNRGVVLVPLEAVLNASSVRGTRRLLQVMTEIALEHHNSMVTFLNPANLTIEERRLLREGARRIRFGHRKGKIFKP